MKAITVSILLLWTVAILAMASASASVEEHATAATAAKASSAECVVGDDGECLNADANVDGSTGSTTSTEDKKGCPDRPHIIKCAGKYLDTNQNGKLDRAELDAAIERLPWYGRGIVKILGSTDKMMKKCDMDGDDAISMDYDMVNNQETCLASCFKRRAFKQAFFADCTL